MHLPLRSSSIVVALSLVGALAGAGCSDEPMVDPLMQACLEDTRPFGGGMSPPDAGMPMGPRYPFQAVLQVEQRMDLTRDGTQSGSFQLVFLDLSTYTGRSAPVAFDSATCWEIVGQPIGGDPATDLTVAGVRVEGLVGGPVDVGAVTGSYRSMPTEMVVGTETISLTSQPDTAAPATFPELRVESAPAAPIADLTTTPLPGGAVELRWAPTGASYIELDISAPNPAAPMDPARVNRVVCQVFDDGCHRVPAASMLYVALNGPVATLKVQRHQVATTMPNDMSTGNVDVRQTLLTEVNPFDGRLLH